MTKNISTAIRQSLSNVNLSETQEILLNEDGIILDSTENLVPLKALLGSSILDICPFMESIFPSLVSALKEKAPIHFPTVEFSISGAPKGYFQFFFTRIDCSHGKCILQWFIVKDRGDLAEKRILQQEVNERLLAEQTLILK